MATLLFILVLLAIFHFIYESIILPMLRLELRYKLFKLRDKLRLLKIEKPEEVEDNLFMVLDETICAVTNRLPFLSISARSDGFREYKNNENFRKSVDKRKSLIRNSENKTIQEINNELIEISTVGFILNSGGWFYIALPLILIALIFAFVFHKIKTLRLYLNKGIYKITYAPENDFTRFANC